MGGLQVPNNVAGSPSGLPSSVPLVLNTVGNRNTNKTLINNAPNLPSQAPGSTPLGIGSVIFNSAECPDDLGIGAVKQMAVTHTLPGGTRLVSTFGPDPSNVKWKGRLYGANVDTRIQQLRLYAVSGQAVLVFWHLEQYTAIVVDFAPTYHYRWYAEYEIELTIVQDQNGAFTLPSGLSIDEQVQGLQQTMLQQNNAIFQIDPTGASSFQQQIASVQTAIGGAGPLATATPSSVAGILTAVNAAQKAVSAYAGPLQQLTGLKIPPQLGSALQLSSTLTNIASNVANGQKPASTIVQGVNLFTVAAQQFGDPTLAFKLAAANGLTSPWLTKSNQTTITLPPFGQQVSLP